MKMESFEKAVKKVGDNHRLDLLRDAQCICPQVDRLFWKVTNLKEVYLH